MANASRSKSSPREPLLSAAIEAAGIGFRVLPLHSIDDAGACTCQRGENCSQAGKHPRVKRWQEVATREEAQITSWWSQWPDANIGAAAGELICLDIDPKSGGDASLRDLEDEHDELPRGAVVKTGKAKGRRGRHYWFANPNGVVVANSAGKIAPGIDVRGAGGFAVLPPSQHRSGVEYEWERAPEIEAAPSWLIELAGEGTRERVIDWKPSGRKPSEEVRRWVREGEWPIGEQRERAPRVIRALLDSGLSRDEVAERVFDALERSDQEPGDPWTREDVERMVKSIATSAPPPRRKESFDPLSLTDQGNAERFAAHVGEDVRWVPRWKSWVYWRGDRWERDEGEFATALVVEVIKGVAKTATHELKDDDAIRKVLAFVARSLTKIRVASALDLAKPLLMARPTDFDADPWLLNCRNGTLDLRALELREHKREDMLTQRVNAEYVADARSEDWERVLADSMRSEELVAYLQRVFGYCLTGDTSEEVFFFFYGKSGAGKGTILESFAGMLGDYARSMSYRTLTQASGQSGSGHSEDVARLHGARFVTASEFERDARLAEAFVNTLTGRDKITARHLHQASFEFFPQLKLFLAANHRPRLSASPQSGIWRRLQTVPFDHVPTAPDKNLKSRLSTDDARAAILAWAVEGLRAWHEQRLGDVPAEVEDANEDYRDEADPYSTFIDERVTREAGEQTTLDEMYAEYENWSRDSGRRTATKQALGRILKERGFEQTTKATTRGRKRSSQRVWRGVRVKGPGVRVKQGNDE